jgi:hypothetical protein
MTRHRGGILLLILVICAVGAATAWRYYNYIYTDPQFCSLCHVTEEGYNSWERSPHYQFICQRCHQMSIMEGNRLLMGYYVKGGASVEQDHGRKNPWKVCLECHENAAAQGSITFRASFGHARHVFMRSVGCENCHAGSMHEMTVKSENCRACHEDKLVHGMGTAGLDCLSCHSFTEEQHNMISSERCFGCHAEVPREGIMARMECYECHHPHAKLKMQSPDCLGSCHSSEIRVGQHKIHIENSNLQCLDCHRQHGWAVTKKNAKGLCDRCHRMKDPATFIY